MNASGARRRKVVFFAEAVTLAHMARPAVLAQALDPAHYEVVFATHPRYLGLFPDLRVPHRSLDSIDPARFMEALAKGRPLYDEDALERYVAEDLAIIDSEQPDIVVGDFRLSLSVSARLRQVPYVALTNAYWSPYADLEYPIPELPLVKFLGLPLAQQLFDWMRPVAFGMHCRPLNSVRRHHGLRPLGSDLRRVYTDSDVLLYADIPELVPLSDLPPNHHFVGPILWSPQQSEPAWWSEVPGDRPSVYLSLGSSGGYQRLPTIVDALLDLPINLLVATAGPVDLGLKAPNLFVAPYLPGEAAASRSGVVISNGGSLTTYQALKHGVPVLGIAANLDQHLNMSAVEHLGAGIRMRSDGLQKAVLRETVNTLLHGESYTRSAAGVGRRLSEYDHSTRFEQVLGSL